MTDEQHPVSEEQARRDFLYLATGAFAAVGAANVVWPLIDQMNPDASVKALASIEIDLSSIDIGHRVTVSWRGKPVFIRRRTQAEMTKREVLPLTLARPAGR